MQEIERKFLVDDFSKIPVSKGERLIIQGYLNQDPERTVRVRYVTIGVTFALGYITVKGKSSDNGMSRTEYEYSIHPDEANEMIKLCTGVITKTRYITFVEGKIWEIDVFHGNNEGLIVAEIELESEDEYFIKPDWITKEVTGDPKYYNSNLTTNPYNTW